MGKKIITLLIIILSLSCNTKFEKNKWNIGTDYEYPYREKMLNDLLNNYDLKGKNVNEILNLLGKPNDFCDQNQYEFGYRIKIINNSESKYDSAIIKSLVLELDKSKPYIDSLTTVINVYLTQ